jgi:phosphoenolpyruvate synthase/pyruvate phosphate dikinase
MSKLLTLNSNVWPADQVGGKAANISKMLDMGLPVPLGFTADTQHTFQIDFEAGERHLAINTESLEEHRTIEIRLHHGTVNVKEIYSWVKYLTSLIKGKAYDKKPVAAFRKLSA